MKLFADGLEAICSLRATPYTDALAQQALGLLMTHLPTSTMSGDRVAERGQCLFAAFMLLPNLLNVGLGIVAGLRHQIGAGHGVPHGVASTIVLPHVLRWNLPAATPQLGETAIRLGVAWQVRVELARQLSSGDCQSACLTVIVMPDCPLVLRTRFTILCRHQSAAGGA